MREEIFAAFRRRLIREGAPRSYADRATRELREHWEDLLAEAERQGLTGAEAEADATRRLGESEALAAELFEARRSASVLARFPTLSFSVLAIVTTVVWWAMCLALTGWATGALSYDAKTSAGPSPMPGILAGVELARWTSYVAAPLLCCYIAREFFCGWRPALWGCAVIALHNAGHFFKVTGEMGAATAQWGYSFGPTLIPNVLGIVAPLAVFALFWIWHRRDDPLQLVKS